LRNNTSKQAANSPLKKNKRKSGAFLPFRRFFVDTLADISSLSPSASSLVSSFDFASAPLLLIQRKALVCFVSTG